MIFIDYNDKRPIYEQVICRFQTLILNGALEPHTQLPSVRSLAIELSINANTIQRAYSELERMGFIYSIKGRGNFVSANEAFITDQKQKELEKLQQHLQTCKEIGIEQAVVETYVQKMYSEVLA